MESWREVTGHIPVEVLVQVLVATSPRCSADCRPVTSLCLSLGLGSGAGRDRRCETSAWNQGKRVSVHSSGKVFF